MTDLLKMLDDPIGWTDYSEECLCHMAADRIRERENQLATVEKNRDNWEQRCGQALADRDEMEKRIKELERVLKLYPGTGSGIGGAADMRPYAIAEFEREWAKLMRADSHECVQS